MELEFFFLRIRFTVACCSPHLECGLWLGLGVQLLGLSFRAFRGARGVSVSFLFSRLLWLERGRRVWSIFSDLGFASFFLSLQFIASYLASLGGSIS